MILKTYKHDQFEFNENLQGLLVGENTDGDMSPPEGKCKGETFYPNIYDNTIMTLLQLAITLLQHFL